MSFAKVQDKTTPKSSVLKNVFDVWRLIFYINLKDTVIDNLLQLL